MERPLDRRIALITGASRGIGAAVAGRFAREGAHVVLVARTVGGLEEIDDQIKRAGGHATLVPFDLRDSDKIHQIGPAILERFGHLDIFVGNAAILGGLMPLGHYQPAEWLEVFNVNLHANWHLARILDPLLRRSDAGRAILVTCDIARRPRAYWGAYAASKAGLEAMARCWAAETAKSELRVNLLDPGPTATRLRAIAYPGEDRRKLPRPDEVTDRFVELASAAFAENGTLTTNDR